MAESTLTLDHDPDAAAKKRLVQSQLKQASNPNQSGYQGAVKTYMNQQQGGAGSPVASARSMASTTSAASPYSTQNYSSQTNELLKSMMDRINQPTKEFSYNPQADPAYQAALARAKANINAGNSQAQAEMNRRGILNSTITSDRMGEISAREMGRVETDTLPSLMQQAYQRYMNDQAQQQQNFANMGNLAQMYSNEDQRGFENRVTEAGLTGNWMSPQASAYLQELLGLKQQAETKGITKDERAQLSSQADGIRAQLQALGVDPSQFAASVSYNQASKVNPGVRTLQGQQADLQNKQSNWNAYMDMVNQTGNLGTGPKHNWQQLQNNANAGGLTLSGQQMQNNMQQQQFNNTMEQMKFDENVRQHGMEYALRQLEADRNYQLNQDRLGLNEAQFGWEMANTNTGQSDPKYSVNANTLQNMLFQQYGVKDADGQTTIPPDRIEDVTRAISAANMSLQDKAYVAQLFGIDPSKFPK